MNLSKHHFAFFSQKLWPQSPFLRFGLRLLSLRLLSLCLLNLFLFSPFALASAYQIKLKQPTFVLPQFTGPFRPREASVAPHEYEMAEQLRGLLEEGEHAQALAMLDEMFTLEISPAMVHLKAQIYVQLDKLEDAEQTFLEVLDRMPQLVRAHSDLAQLYMFQEKYKQARQHFAKAVSFGANDAHIHGQLGFLNMQQHNAWSAISAYQNALALEPENPQWQHGLLTALSSAHMYESALAFLDEIIAQKPTDKELWLHKTSLNLQLDNTQDALKALEMAIRMGADDSYNLEVAAQMHLQLNSYDRGLALLQHKLAQKKLNIDTIDKALAWFLHKDLHQHAESLLKPLEKRLSELNPQEQSRIHLHKANLHLGQKRQQQSNAQFEQALTKDPGNANALIAYAESLRKQKQYTQADLFYSRASAISSHADQATRGKIRLYIDMLDYQSALELLRSEYKKHPEMHDLKENINIIENILEAKKLAEI